MKKIAILLLIVIAISLSGCLKRDDLENVAVYTTVYPIEYLTNVLYGYNSEVFSIYPDGVDINTYELTSKQIKDYSKAAIFVYNGLTNEKQIAKDFINKNKNIRIIDVSFGLKYENTIEELWLSPNNYLMLATTIKNNLQDYITNKYIKDEIESNYSIKLEENLSLMDAHLRDLGTISKDEGRNTLVVSSKVFLYLENYGFDIIVLDDETSLTPNNLNALKNSFKNGTYHYIFLGSNESSTIIIDDLVTSNNAQVISFNIMDNLTDEQRKNNETYFTLMQQNIENIKLATIGK